MSYKIGDTITLTKFINGCKLEQVPYTIVDFTEDGTAVCENKDELEIVFAQIMYSSPFVTL